jgi:hypothetical protein
VLTFGDEEELGAVGGADTAARERLRADSRSWRPVGRHRRRRMKPSPPAAAAASPLLGIRDGSMLGPRRRRRGRAGTAAAGESSGEGQPSRSAGAASSWTPNRQVGGLYGFEASGGAMKRPWGGLGSAPVSGGQRAAARLGWRRRFQGLGKEENGNRGDHCWWVGLVAANK